MRRKQAVKLSFCIGAVFLCVSPGLPAQDRAWFDKGLKAFRNQNIDQAIVFFERAGDAEPRNDEIPLFLGVLYHEAGQMISAEEAYGRGLDLAGPNRDRLRLNRGNLRFTLGDLDGARDDFTVLVNGFGSLASQARLNRANAALNGGILNEALNDYQTYLAEEPRDPQRNTIERLIELLKARLAAEERERLAAEEQARLEQELRELNERRLAEEEARRRSLMDEVLQTLGGSGEDTTGIGAGSETVQDEFEESELED